MKKVHHKGSPRVSAEDFRRVCVRAELVSLSRCDLSHAPSPGRATRLLGSHASLGGRPGGLPLRGSRA